MRRVIKNILVALLTVTMVVSMAACGQDKGGNSESTTSPTSSTSAETTKKPEPVTLKWKMQAPEMEKPEPVWKALNDMLLEKYNLMLEIDLIPLANYNDQMNMVVSSGEYYDLCNTSTSRNQYMPNVAKGALLQLDDLLTQRHPDLNGKVLPSQLLDNARVDGKLYAIPNYQAIYRQWGVYYRHDLAEKYGWNFDAAKEWKDLEPYLKQVKENEKSYFPIDFNFQLSVAGEICDLTQEIHKIDDYAFVKRSDPYKVISPWEQMHDLYSMVNDWWQKGYIQKDIATTQTREADLAAGKYAFFLGLVNVGSEVAMSKLYGAEYDVKAMQEPWLQATSGRSTMNGINSRTKYPAEAFDMIYIMNTDKEAFNTLNYGIEGVNYTLDAEKKVVETPNSGYFLNYAWSYGNNLNAYLQVGQEDNIWTETDRINREAKAAPLPGFSVNTTQLSDLLSQRDAISSEYKNIWYQKDFEKRWNERRLALEPVITQYLTEAQKQLDNYKAAKGIK